MPKSVHNVLILVLWSIFSLISSMLRREPKERISLKEIMSHAWMQGGKCCANQACVALVGKEHLSSQDQESIIQTMVDGNIASRSEILRYDFLFKLLCAKLCSQAIYLSISIYNSICVFLCFSTSDP